MMKTILNLLQGIGRRVISYLPKLSMLKTKGMAPIITQSSSGTSLTPNSTKTSKVITLYDSPFGRKAVKSHSVNGVTVVYKGQQRFYTQNLTNPNTSISLIPVKNNTSIAIIDKSKSSNSVVPISIEKPKTSIIVYEKDDSLPITMSEYIDKYIVASRYLMHPELSETAANFKNWALVAKIINKSLRNVDNAVPVDEFHTDVPKVKLNRISVDRKGLRCMEFQFSSKDDVLIVLFVYTALTILCQEEEFKKFGHYKTLMSTAEIKVVSDKNKLRTSIISLHKNVLINNDHTPIEILNLMINMGLKSYYSDYYPYIHIKKMVVQVWNMDVYANKHIKINRIDKTCVDLKTGKSIDRSSLFLHKTSAFNHTDVINKRSFHTTCSLSKNVVKPLKKVNRNDIGLLKRTKSISTFGTGDIETVNIDNLQIPIAISACYESGTTYFQVDRDLMHSDCENAVQNMFNEYFDFIIKQNVKTIFYHNLGRFDGVFIFTALIKYAKSKGKLDDIETMIDTNKSFLSIKYYCDEEGGSIVFQDSLRLFGVSLKNFCKVYGVEGKISDYNIDFNNLELLDNPALLKVFKEYSLQDSKCLYDALKKAQEIYFANYSVDITGSLSTAALSKKIFRTHFLKKPIPTLSGTMDSFIRDGYFGGATDIYHQYGENLYYYDVNSLYPHVMKKKIPTKIIKRYGKGDPIDLNNFFGFIKCVVKCPKNIKHPIIPLRTKTRTIYPTGTWEGTYFSETIKEAIKYGYEFEIIMGVEFEGEYIFAEYIDHFYKIKSEAKANGDKALTFLAKMHLNQLYGVFGMKQESLSTVIIDNIEIPDYFQNNLVKTIMKIDDDTSVALIDSSERVPDSNTITEFMYLEDSKGYISSIKSNVAIAAAVTAYAQILMMQFKNNPDYNIYYTDTDSIFIDKPLPNLLVGESLGQLKNETLDKYGVEQISFAYFLGTKKYGYRVIKEGVNYDSSVVAGVERDSLDMGIIKKLSEGFEHVTPKKTRFHHSSDAFSIFTRDISATVTKDCHKELVNKFYVPEHVDEAQHS